MRREFICRPPDPAAHHLAKDRVAWAVMAEPCSCVGVRLVDDGTCAKCGHFSLDEIAETWAEAA